MRSNMFREVLPFNLLNTLCLIELSYQEDFVFINEFRQGGEIHDIIFQSRCFCRWNPSWYQPSSKKDKRDKILTKLSTKRREDSSCKCGVSPLKSKIVN